MDEFNTPPNPTPIPEPSAIPPIAPPLSSTSASDSTGLPPNIAAGLCATVPLVGGIVFLVLEKTNAFVRFWAMQSVIFGAALLAISIMLHIATFILGIIPILGWLMILVLALAGFVLWIGGLIVWAIMMIKAFSGVEWELPYIGKLARRQLLGAPLI